MDLLLTHLLLLFIYGLENYVVQMRCEQTLDSAGTESETTVMCLCCAT
jgi:hypothetical protein